MMMMMMIILCEMSNNNNIIDCYPEQRILPLDDYPDNIPIIQDDVMSYCHFYERFILSNTPCIIRNHEEAACWKSTREWVLDYETGPELNIDKLTSSYGTLHVPVTVCRDTLNHCCGPPQTFQEYAQYWKNTNRRDENEKIYLKDWHLRKMSPDDRFYRVPKYFASDWLNEYALDTDTDDFMFVYMGVRGTWTPFHKDVYSSFSWSANIMGRKHWILLFPGQEKNIQKESRSLPTDVRNLLNESIKYYDFVQERGDIIFVPSGWYHQVHNIEDTVSINHNWVNAANIMTMWRALNDDLHSVENEIEEFSETDGWSEHCQVMLKALFGINHEDFLTFILHICTKRLKSASHNEDFLFDLWSIGRNQVLFDLKSLKVLSEDMVHSRFYKEKRELLSDLIDQINMVILQ